MTEWNARGYQSVSHLQEAIATEQLARIALGERDRVLDIGCGNGKITAAIAARIPEGSVLGIDASQNMIRFAQAHYPAPNLDFQVEDARTLPFHHEFNRIVSFNAIHWIPDQGAVLRSIRTALTSDGQALLRFVPAGPRQCIEDVIEAVCQLPPWAQYFSHRHRPYCHPSLEAYQTLAEQNGLEVLHLHREDKAWDFGSRQGFVEYCQVTLAEWTRFLPEQEWSPFITAVLDRYQAVAADNPAENNTFKFYPLEVLLRPQPHRGDGHD